MYCQDKSSSASKEKEGTFNHEKSKFLIDIINKNYRKLSFLKMQFYCHIYF